MSEIYKGSSQTIYLDLYAESADTLPSVTVNGTTLQVQTETAPSGITQRYSAVIGLANTQTEGELDVTWNLTINGTAVTKTDTYDVVTPYVSIADVKKIWSQLDDDAAADLESNVRHIIESYCGQKFGSVTKSITVRGNGDEFLALPERLVTLQGIATLTTTLDINDSIVTGDGWYLKKGWTSTAVYTPTNDLYFAPQEGLWINTAEPGDPGYEQPDHGYVIQAPLTDIVISTPWMRDYPFTITGVWGHSRVPTDVTLAAKLLINDYGCNEVLYRDRYLKSISFADSDIDFSGASWFDSTGNVRADQLLAKHVSLGWGVL